ncbi:uncharacterized protein LOC117322658 [Pecten maximus]|uniref:uncharacterized protein LOC117322658 n=1 Tax=Pecten maximus TaxID=6579 RepID=UPI001458BE5E|nr:uncharacterized protein LOC117322658 [Pecten maximus]
MQIDGLSATARKIDEVHFSLEKESKQTWYDVCPRCKEKVNKYNITQYRDVECQTENNENPLTKALLDGLNGRLTFRLCVPEESGSDLEQWCLTPYLSTGCERQGTGRILHTHFTDDSSTQQCNELKQAVESEKETISSDVNAVTDSLKGIFPKLPEEIQKLEDTIESKDKELWKLKEKNNTLKKEVEALQSERKTLRKENGTLKAYRRIECL